MPREPGEGTQRAGWHPLLLAGVGLCVLALMFGAVGLAGGFDELPEKQPPAVTVDAVSEGVPWNVTVTSAGLYTDLSPAVLREEDSHWLGVVAEVEVTSEQSRTDLRDALYVRGIDGLTSESGVTGIPEAVQASDVRVVSDATAAVSVHPGLPERLVFLWERVSDAPPPSEIEVRIVGMTYREDSFSGHMVWRDWAPRARVTVPLEDKRDA